MSNTPFTPLEELELYELLAAAYPEKFSGDDSESDFLAAMEFAASMWGEADICDLLGRVVMLAMPMTSPLTGEIYHALGKITIADHRVNMVAIVKRRLEGQP